MEGTCICVNPKLDRKETRERNICVKIMGLMALAGLWNSVMVMHECVSLALVCGFMPSSCVFANVCLWRHQVRDEKELIRDVETELSDVEGKVNKLKSQCEHGNIAAMLIRANYHGNTCTSFTKPPTSSSLLLQHALASSAMQPLQPHHLIACSLAGMFGNDTTEISIKTGVCFEAVERLADNISYLAHVPEAASLQVCECV